MTIRENFRVLILLLTIGWVATQPTNIAHATDVSGTCTGTWDPANNPFRLVGTCTVPAGQTLTILPDVIVNGQGNRIQTDGVLNIDGAAFTNMIAEYRTGSSGTVQNSAFTGGYVYTQGSSVLTPITPQIINNTFTTTGTAIHAAGTSRPTVSGNTITAFTGMVLYGDSQPTVTNNTITTTTTSTSGGVVGIYVYDQAQPTLTDNTITTNGYGLRFLETSRGQVTGTTIHFRPEGNSSRKGIQLEDTASPTVSSNTIQADATRSDFGLVLAVDALNGTTAFTYDENGNVLTVKDALNQTTTYAYDNMDQLIRRTDPLGSSEQFEYDRLGNLTRHLDRKGQESRLSYDALDRLVAINYADSSTSFVYDTVGRIVQATDSLGGAIVNEYDELDRLITQATGQGAVEYAYDALDRRVSMHVTGQAPVNYSYDANSRLTRVSQSGQIVDFDYDVLDRRTRLTLPNGLSTEYQYDIASRLTEQIYRNATGVLGNLAYQYDAAGSRTSSSGSFVRTLLPDPVTTATYDAANRPNFLKMSLFSIVVRTGLMTEGFRRPAACHSVTLTSPIAAELLIWLVMAMIMRSGRS